MKRIAIIVSKTLSHNCIAVAVLLLPFLNLFARNFSLQYRKREILPSILQMKTTMTYWIGTLAKLTYKPTIQRMNK